MRQTRVAGERLFVDYAGTTLEVIDGLTGEVTNGPAARRRARAFYASATWTRGLADWIGSPTRACVFIGGATAMVARPADGTRSRKAVARLECSLQPRRGA